MNGDIHGNCEKKRLSKFGLVLFLADQALIFGNIKIRGEGLFQA